MAQKVGGSFTATGQSASAYIEGPFNVSIWGTFVGTVKVERSFDGGTTWLVCSRDAEGAEAAFTAPATLRIDEPERDVKYRVNCTAFTSGTINYRLSQ